MEKPLKKYCPKPKSEFKKGLFKRFDEIGAVEELNRKNLELEEKRKNKKRNRTTHALRG